MSVDPTAVSTVDRRPLHDGWSARLIEAREPAPSELLGRSIPAMVPGCIHTDLLAAGLIPDPYLEQNELALRWIGRTDWEYAMTFDWMEGGHERVDLVFDGLDTVATIVLNGTVVARTANMHRTWRFDIRAGLRPGPNHLSVRLVAPLTEVDRLHQAMGDWPHSNREPEAYNLLRKMACNFGWDWGPQLATVGIWRPVWLESWSGARLAAVRPSVALEGGRGLVDLDIEVDRSASGRGPVRVVASASGTAAETVVEDGRNRGRVRLAVDDVQAWWPHSHGPQPLYDLEVTAQGEDGSRDAWHRRIGFRTVELDTQPDTIGRRWRIVVNGRPLWVRGANWIPDDCFPTRVDASRYRRRIEQAVGANIDLLRVWGGGIYESDDLYAACDEAGVLVWQDFPFACATYPETPDLRADVEAEARDNVTRLMPHPSLALWNGNNECTWLAELEGWATKVGDRPWGLGYYDDLLPRVVAELDPSRPYWQGTPDSGDRATAPNDPRFGTVHLWDVWNRLDYAEYRRNHPRFVAEFGYQGPPTWSTLRRALSDPELAVDSPGLVHHQKAIDGMAKLERGLRAHFREPADFDDWLFLTQVNQARAIRLGIEHFRSIRDTCSGAIVWQLNDCWPVISWAAVDGDGRRKPLWYALRRAFADHLLTIQPDGSDLRVVAVNDGHETWTGDVTMIRVGLDGGVLAEEQLRFEAPSAQRWSSTLPTAVAVPADPAAELLVATSGTLRSVWSWVPDRDLRMPPARFAPSAELAAGGYLVTVTATSLLRDLCLFPDRLDPAAEVDDLLVTLLPGESARFHIATAADVDPLALTRHPVLRCVNDTPGVLAAR